MTTDPQTAEPVDFRTAPPKIAPIATGWQAWWEDHDFWDGAVLYADLGAAKLHAAVDYIGEEYGWVPGDDPADEAPDATLTWVFEHARWYLLDSGRSTSVQLYKTATYYAPAAPVAAPPTGQTDETTAEHHVVDGVKYLCHTADHYCPAEPHRLALSTALSLDPSAPWDAIRERAAELAGQPMDGGQDDTDRRVYAWAQTIDTADSGRTVHIPGVHHDGNGPEEIAIVVHREDIPVLAGMLAEAGGAPADQAAVLREAADAVDRLRATLAPSVAHRYESGLGLASTELRRLADETPGPETQGEAHPPETYWQVETQWRSGDWHSWALRTEHDDALEEFERAQDVKSAWRLVRFHTTTAVEAEHRPDTEPQDAPPVEPHPTEAGLRHAQAVLDKFHGRDTTGAAAPETVHACPPEGSGLTPCCGRTPFELPRTDRISSEAPVTCTGQPAVVAEPGKENGHG